VLIETRFIAYLFLKFFVRNGIAAPENNCGTEAAKFFSVETRFIASFEDNFL
jgi:hypothetical protein